MKLLAFFVGSFAFCFASVSAEERGLRNALEARVFSLPTYQRILAAFANGEPARAGVFWGAMRDAMVSSPDVLTIDGVTAAQVVQVLKQFNDRGYRFPTMDLSEERLAEWRRESRRKSRPIVSESGTAPRSYPVLARPVQYLSLKPGVFSKDKAGRFLRNAEGELVRTDIPERKYGRDLSRYCLKNAYREFVLRDHEVAIDLAMPVRTVEDFHLVIHLLAQTGVGAAVLRTLVNAESKREGTAEPLDVFMDKNLGILAIPQDVIQVDARVLSPVRPEARVRIEKRPWSGNVGFSPKIFFKKGTEVGLLLADIFYAMGMDFEMGLSSLELEIYGDDDSARNFPFMRRKLQIQLQASLDELDARIVQGDESEEDEADPETSAREILLTEFERTMARIEVEERAYLAQRFAYLLELAHGGIAAHLQELSRNFRDVNLETFDAYFRKQERLGKLYGATKAKSRVELYEAYGYDAGVLARDAELECGPALLR